MWWITVSLPPKYHLHKNWRGDIESFSATYQKAEEVLHQLASELCAELVKAQFQFNDIDLMIGARPQTRGFLKWIGVTLLVPCINIMVFKDISSYTRNQIIAAAESIYPGTEVIFQTMGPLNEDTVAEESLRQQHLVWKIHRDSIRRFWPESPE